METFDFIRYLIQQTTTAMEFPEKTELDPEKNE